MRNQFPRSRILLLLRLRLFKGNCWASSFVVVFLDAREKREIISHRYTLLIRLKVNWIRDFRALIAEVAVVQIQTLFVLVIRVSVYLFHWQSVSDLW